MAIGTDKLRKNWNHLALVVNRLDGEVRHFLNGRLVGSDDFTEGIYGDFHLGDWYLGGIPGLSDFNGSIDDARIYSSALSDEDIAFIYNGGAGDMGVVGIVDSPNITLDNPISVNRDLEGWFGRYRIGPRRVRDKWSLSGGTIVPGSFVSNDGNQTFSFQIVPDADALEIDLSLPGGAGSFDGEPTLAIYKTIGIVPEVLARDQISNWWWFNEGLGDMATDSIGDNHGSLIGGAGWAADAIEGTSVEFEKPSQMIDLGSVSLSPFNPGLFQLSFWFKRKNEAFTWSTEQISNVMLSMGDENSSTLQIGTNGQTVEVFMDTAVRSQRISIGSGVTKNQWHHLMVSYDENATDGYELKVYLDGQLSGYSSDLGGILQVKASDYWLLGAASKISPTNGRFIGLIDDMRFYTTQEAEKISSENYSNGSGDLQLSVNVSHPASTHDNPIFADLTFRKYGVDYPIADFNSSRITIRGGDLIGVSGSGAYRRIEFNSTVDPGRITVDLLKGLGVDVFGEESLSSSFVVGFARPFTRVESLTAWWTFDEGSGVTVTDSMNGFVGDFFSGDWGASNVTFDSANAMFGSALRFPKNAWVETNALASNLGMDGGKPRTISFWIFVESGQSGQPGPYGLGQRSCPNSTHRMWGFRDFWDGNYRRFRTQHWCWDPDVWVSEGMRDKWMHLAHVYTGSNVQVYVNGTIRRDWIKDDIDTGNSYPLQFGRWTEEDNNLGRTFKGLLDDFRVYDDWLNASDVSKIYGNGSGDLKVTAEFDLPGVIDTVPMTGRIHFLRNELPLEVGILTYLI